MRDAKAVAVMLTAPTVRVTSAETLVPRSPRSGSCTCSRVRPAASVSSVKGVVAKKPRPTESRLVQPPARIRPASRPAILPGFYQAEIG
jgi:hypothetical protein